MEGPTGIRWGHMLVIGKFYSELVVDQTVLRVGLGLLVRSDTARVSIGIGVARLVIGYAKDFC